MNCIHRLVRWRLAVPCEGSRLSFRANQVAPSVFARALGLFLVVVLRTPETEGTPRWFHFGGEELETTGPVGRESLEKVALRLKLFRQLFEKTLGVPRQLPGPLRAYVFETEHDYKPFAPAKDFDRGLSSGFFRRDLDRATLAFHLGSGSGRDYELAFHLYAHILIGSLADHWPLWWTEGVAEFLSTVTFERERAHLGAPLRRHMEYLQQNPPLAVSELFSMRRRAWAYDEGEKSGPFYATAWLLVHTILVESDIGNPAKAMDFVALLSKGTDASKALAEAFQLDLTVLDSELRKNARRFMFPSQNLKLASLEPSVAAVRDLTAAEEEAYKGDLFFRTFKSKEAEGCFRKAIALDSQSPMGYEGMGFLRTRQNRRGAAAEFFKAAIDRGSKTLLPYYYHAESLVQELSRDPSNTELAKVARRELDGVVALKPDFAPAHHLLAHLPLAMGRGFEEGIPFAEAALNLEPGNEKYRLTLAKLQFHSKRFAEAQASLAPLLNSENSGDAAIGSLKEMIEDSINRKRELELLIKENTTAPR